MLQVPDDILALIKLREGWSTTVYRDTKGYLTAGTGHKLTPSELHTYPLGSEVPEDVLTSWEVNDTLNAYRAAVQQAHLADFNDPRLVFALTPVNFQLGTNWTTIFKRMWGDIVNHDWTLAAQEAENSLWYEETPLRVKDFQSAILSLTDSSQQN